MNDEQTVDDATFQVATSAIPASEVEVRSVEAREIGALIVPWDEVVDTPIGLESFQRGSFAHIDAQNVVLRLGHEGPPVGKGISIEERADGPHMVFRVSKTQRGDEALELARDGVTRHVSIEYAPRTSQSTVENRGGKRVTRVTKADLRGVATTYLPYYDRAAVTYVRSVQEGDAPMSGEIEAPDGATTQTAGLSPEMFQRAIEQMSASFSKPLETITDRLATLEERSRSGFEIPSTSSAPKAEPARGEWMSTALRIISGDRVPDLEVRALANLITTDNAGVVPDAFSTELIGVIDPSRPFMQSTRRLDTPAAGMSLMMPRIVTRPTVGLQAAEKNELASTATAIDTVTFDAITIGGAGDISLQLLKRSSPAFLGLYLELLAEAYAANTEDRAVTALLAQAPVVEGGILNPAAVSFGGAWTNGVAARLRPDTIWLSSAAVAAFIDAKASGTNAPLWSVMQGNFTAAGGVGGSISGLRPVHVPALDNEAVAIIVGPSRGFAWTEDGTYTLQVDVPAKAGRDVALVGILWFAPLYPAAFTSYTLPV